MLYCAVKYTVSGPAGRLQHSSVGAVQHWLPWAAPTQGAVPSLPTPLGEDHVFIGSTGPGKASGTVILGGSPETCPKYTNLYILERETLSCQRATKDMEKINFLPTVLCSLMLICPSSGSLVGHCPPHPFSLTCIFPRTFSLPCLPIGPISCSAPPPFTLLDVTLGPAFAPPLSPQPIGPDALLHPTVPIFKPGSSTHFCLSLDLSLVPGMTLPCGTPHKDPSHLSFVHCLECVSFFSPSVSLCHQNSFPPLLEVLIALHYPLTPQQSLVALCWCEHATLTP